MNQRVRRLCPYTDCGWHYDEPPPDPDPTISTEARFRRYVAAVEAVCRAHLDVAHPGWTPEELAAESQAHAARSVFNASPFSSTTPQQ